MMMMMMRHRQLVFTEYVYTKIIVRNTIDSLADMNNNDHINGFNE